MDKITHILRRWTKEIIIAIILAVLAAYYVEGNLERAKLSSISDISKASTIIQTYDKDGKPLAFGSGLFISSDGKLITNYHVIDKSNLPLTEAKLTNGAYYKIQKIIGISRQEDIAILQFEAKDVPYVDISRFNSDDVKTGETVYVIGNPLGVFENSLTEGVISSPKRIIDNNTYIQFTAPISSGNGGGPLFEKDGKVIGLATLSIQIPPELQKEITTQNLNFAVPINLIKANINGVDRILTNESPDYYYSLATLQSNEKKDDEAIINYKKAIKLNNKYADAYVGLGGIYYDKGMYQQEAENYQKAVDLNPTNSDYYWYLGTAYEDVENYSQAAITYETSLKYNSDNKDSLYQLGLMYLILGQNDKMTPIISKLSRLDAGLGKELKILQGR